MDGVPQGGPHGSSLSHSHCLSSGLWTQTQSTWWFSLVGLRGRMWTEDSSGTLWTLPVKQQQRTVHMRTHTKVMLVMRRASWRTAASAAECTSQDYKVSHWTMLLLMQSVCLWKWGSTETWSVWAAAGSVSSGSQLNCLHFRTSLNRFFMESLRAVFLLLHCFMLFTFVLFTFI